jgi:hypothetical protein
MSADVLVAGLVPLPAPPSKRAGRRDVLLIESLPRFGALIHLRGWSTPVAVLPWERALGGRQCRGQTSFYLRRRRQHPPLKIRFYCEQSSAHFDWLVAQGVPNGEQLARR